MGSKKRAAADDNEHRAKRTKSPGVRVVGGRIYDSENGKTCHQVIIELCVPLFFNSF